MTPPTYVPGNDEYGGNITPTALGLLEYWTKPLGGTVEPIPSEDIADIIDMRLAEKMEMLSINEIPMGNIHWGNGGFKNPWENMFTYNQRKRYKNLGGERNVNILARDQSHCGCGMCTSTEIKIR